MNLTELRYPVFRLSNSAPLERDGVLFYTSLTYDLETMKQQQVIDIVDDKNLPGETLGRRRLRIQDTDVVRIFPIKRALYFLRDLIKYAKGNLWFIDSNGKVFQYIKKSKAKLVCAKIEKILPLEGGVGSIVVLSGIPMRFKTLFHPPPDVTHAGVLLVGGGYILYDLYKHAFKNSWRLV